MKTVEARPYDLIAIVGDDDVVIALGWHAPGAQGDMRPLTLSEAKQMRAHLDLFIKASEERTTDE